MAKKYTGKKRNHKLAILTSITITAMMVALSIALEYFAKAIPGLQMPMGGTYSLTCLPLIIGSLYTGPIFGTIGGFLYGLLNFLIDGYGLHWGSLFLDYLLAFAFMGVAGFFSKAFYQKKWWSFIVASIVCMTLRYLSSSLSGVLYFPPDDGTNKYLYSFVLYNGPYMLASLGLDLVGGIILMPALFTINDEYYLTPLKNQVGIKQVSHIDALNEAIDTEDEKKINKELALVLKEENKSVCDCLRIIYK